jgi:hypothetical protein
MPRIKTSSWFDVMPANHVRIGISRGVPRCMAAGYRVFRKLAPGPWFNSVGVEEYYQRYCAEILGPLNPHDVAAELAEMAAGGVAVMLCYERAGSGQWCHRALAAAWLAQALGIVIPEYGFEELPQERHPMLAIELRHRIHGAAAGPDRPADPLASPPLTGQTAIWADIVKPPAKPIF